MGIIESERLAFRLMSKEDADALYGIWGDPETMRYCGRTVDRESLPRIIEANEEAYSKHANAVFAVVSRADGALIGICGGKLEEDPSRLEVIIHLVKDAWGKGYATEALSAYVSWVKEYKKASYLYASAHPDNAASIKMLKKCGFEHKGFVQYEDTGFVDEPFFEMHI